MPATIEKLPKVVKSEMKPALRVCLRQEVFFLRIRLEAERCQRWLEQADDLVAARDAAFGVARVRHEDVLDTPRLAQEALRCVEGHDPARTVGAAPSYSTIARIRNGTARSPASTSS